MSNNAQSSNNSSQKQVRSLKLDNSLENVRAFIAATEPNNASAVVDNLSTPKKSSQSTNLTSLAILNRSRALHKNQGYESESSTIVEEVSPSVKRKRSSNDSLSQQGPTNIEAKNRKVVKQTKKGSVDRSENEEIKFYQQKVINEKMISLNQQKKINSELLKVSALTGTIASVQENCQKGLFEANSLSVKYVPQHVSLSKCNNDPDHARIHNTYMNRISKMDHDAKKIEILSRTLKAVIDNCHDSLLKIVNDEFKPDCVTGSKKQVRISAPSSTALYNKKFAKCTSKSVSFDDKNNTETTVEVEKTIEIEIPVSKESQKDLEDWHHIKQRYLIATADKLAMDAKIEKFKKDFAGEQLEEVNFETFNLSQDSTKAQTSSSSKKTTSRPKKILGFSFIDYPDCYLELANSLPLKDSPVKTNNKASSMRVETGTEDSENEK